MTEMVRKHKLWKRRKKIFGRKKKRKNNIVKRLKILQN